ncbi:hypothetical protein Ancab_031528 [Ancistrocladus abbreviatus]
MGLGLLEYLRIVASSSDDTHELGSDAKADWIEEFNSTLGALGVERSRVIGAEGCSQWASAPPPLITLKGATPPLAMAD